MACLSTRYADMYQASQGTRLTRIASQTYDAGRPALTRLSAAIVALQPRPSIMHVRQTCMRSTWVAVGGRSCIASHARLCAGREA
jgi:hypothetical protein